MVEFTNQTELRQDIIDALSPMIPEMEKWRDTWNKLSEEEKIDWVVEGKSMFMSAAAGMFIYLLPFFKDILINIENDTLVLNLEEMTIRRIGDE